MMNKPSLHIIRQELILTSMTKMLLKCQDLTLQHHYWLVNFINVGVYVERDSARMYILSLVFTANENISKDCGSCRQYYVGMRCCLFERYKF